MPLPFSRRFTLAPLAMLTLAPLAAPQVFHERAQVHAPVPHRDDRFGRSVAVDGDTLVVGAPYEGNQGAAYVFVRSGGTWIFQARLVPSQPRFDAEFGSSVAISGDTVAVGADHDDLTVLWGGSVTLFTRSGTVWSEVARVEADDVGADDRFGNVIALEGDTLVVGAHFKTFTGIPFSGSAYVFKRSGSTWSQEAHLLPDDWLTQTASHGFGESLALSGDTVVVGELSGPFIIEEGVATVFVRSGTTWSQQARLRAPDLTNPLDHFGSPVALDGDTAAVASRAASGTEAVYVFERAGTSWTFEAKLLAVDAAGGDEFGNVVLSGDTLAVGAPFEDHHPAGASAGAVYLYRRNGAAWTLKAKLVASDGAQSDAFGGVLALSGPTLVAGTPGNTIGAALYEGSAYVLEQDPGPGPVIDAVTPATFDALLPGTEQSIVLTGSGLDLSTALLVDGNPVDPARYTLVSPERITLDMPQVDVYAWHHPVGVELLLHALRAVGPENADEVVVVALVPPEPRYELGNGDPLNVVHRATGLDYVLAGEPGRRLFVLASPSNVPSVNALVSLGLGNGFTSIRVVGDVTIPQAGWIGFHLPPASLCDPGALGLTLYSQLIDLHRPPPYRVSNLQSMTFVR